MAASILGGIDTFTFAIAIGSLTILGGAFFYLFGKPTFPKNSPPLAPEQVPVFGALRFFSDRWGFYQRSRAFSKSGNFSFHLGQYPVIGLSGEDGRRVFFEHKGLAFAEGYAALLGGQPQPPAVKEDDDPDHEERAGESGFSTYFNKRLLAMLKGPVLKKNLPQLLQDVRDAFDALGPDGMTDPFDSIYRIVYRLTMRTVACNEIASDPVLLEKSLQLYEVVERTNSSLSIMYPWLPLPAKAQRTYAGAQLYMIFKRIIDDRNKTGRREEDALQYLMDQGDSVTKIITFVLGALFAGQLNSGINAAWILLYLTSKPQWLDWVREEVIEVADRYCQDKSLPLKERLMQVPIEAWEGEFPRVDLCLKDSIRLQSSGVMFRHNRSGQDIQINKAGEVIPSGAYVGLAAADINFNPGIYKDPNEWDPSRYFPERQEDKNQAFGSMTWGLGRHPCLGMRFAKLENNLITAFFLAYFDEITLADANGAKTTRLPHTDLNRWSASKPDGQTFLKYKSSASMK